MMTIEERAHRLRVERDDARAALKKLQAEHQELLSWIYRFYEHRLVTGSFPKDLSPQDKLALAWERVESAIINREKTIRELTNAKS